MKENVNFIKHMTETFRRFAEDSRGTGNHRALYLALFDCWNRSYFRTTISICRDEVMRISGIRSTTLYYKCIKDLHAWDYISYEPSNSIYTGSKIQMRRFDVADDPTKAVADGEVAYESAKWSDIQLDDQLDTQLNDQLQVQSINNSNYTGRPHPLHAATPEEDSDDLMDWANAIDDLPVTRQDDQRRGQLDDQLNDQLQVQSINNSNYTTLPRPLPEGNETGITAAAVTSNALDWLTQDDDEPPREPDVSQESTYIPDREVQPPSLDEVVKYFQGKHFEVGDATMFFKYYEALGWVGKRKVPIENWQMYALCWMGHVAQSLLWANRVRPNWRRYRASA